MSQENSLGIQFTGTGTTGTSARIVKPRRSALSIARAIRQQDFDSGKRADNMTGWSTGYSLPPGTGVNVPLPMMDQEPLRRQQRPPLTPRRPSYYTGTHRKSLITATHYEALDDYVMNSEPEEVYQGFRAIFDVMQTDRVLTQDAMEELARLMGHNETAILGINTYLPYGCSMSCITTLDAAGERKEVRLDLADGTCRYIQV